MVRRDGSRLSKSRWVIRPHPRGGGGSRISPGGGKACGTLPAFWSPPVYRLLSPNPGDRLLLPGPAPFSFPRSQAIFLAAQLQGCWGSGFPQRSEIR